MKSKTFIILILAFLIFGFESETMAQPNWDVNSHDFEYSMNITGKVTTDGYFSGDENDMVAAFVNDECRGVANLKYESFAYGCYIYLMIYSNTPFEKISFKIFDASQNEVVPTNNIVDFVINQVVGSIENPFIFSSGNLNHEASLLDFKVPYQISETLINSHNVSLEISAMGSLTELVANFTTSSGATTFVNGVEQTVNVTVNDFTQPLDYMIVSADLTDTTIYSVNITSDMNDPPTAINLSNSYISESTEVNEIVAQIQVKDPDSLDIHQLALIEGNGTNDAQNSFFKIEDDNLILLRPLNFENLQFLNILVRATDSQGASIEKSLSLQVTNENDPPEFVSTPPGFVLQDETFVYAVSTHDADGDTVTLSVVNLPDWLTFNSNTNVISGVAGNNLVGDYSFNIKANDGQFESFQAVIFSVINVNDHPEINFFISTQRFIANRNNLVHLPSGCIIDPDANDELTFNLGTENNSALPEWFDFDAEQLIISGFPPAGTNTSYTLKLTATDKGNLKEYIVFTLEVSTPTAIGDVESGYIFRVYPNPVENFLHVISPHNGLVTQISISNISGSVIQTKLLDAAEKYEINLEGVSPGIYFVLLQQGNTQQMRKNY